MKVTVDIDKLALVRYNRNESSARPPSPAMAR